MDDVGRWFLFLITFIFCCLFSGVAAALPAMREEVLLELAGNEKRQKKLENTLLKYPVKRLASLMELNYLICFSLSMISAFTALSSLIRQTVFYQELIAQPEFYMIWIARLLLFLLALLITWMILTLSYLLPKRVIIHHPEAYLIRFYPSTRILCMILRPLTWLISGFANSIAKLFGFSSRNSNDAVTEEEIRSLVEEGEETGVIEQEEREMINNIFDFDDRTASDLMTHRTQVVALDIHSKISDVVYYAINEGFSRIPVYENDIDNIKGVIYVKDLLCLVGCQSSSDFSLQDFIRETIYVPEAKKCVDLFRMFKLKKVHMAVVIDDYGGTAGIITMEDLLESIVGNIQDEYDDEQEEILKLDDETYLLSGAIDLEKINRLFRTKMEHDEDTDTLGGLITDTLGYIPDDNENPTLVLNGIQFTVVLIEDRRIIKVKAKIQSPPQEDLSEEEEDNT